MFEYIEGKRGGWVKVSLRERVKFKWPDMITPLSKSKSKTVFLPRMYTYKGHGFDSRSSRHVGTLGKFLTHNSLWRFGVKLRHSIRAVLGAPLSSSGLEEAQ